MDVFGANGSNPTNNWKIVGAVQRVFDKSVKGYVFRCDGGPTAKMQLPKVSCARARLADATRTSQGLLRTSRHTPLRHDPGLHPAALTTHLIAPHAGRAEGARAGAAVPGAADQRPGD